MTKNSESNAAARNIPERIDALREAFGSDLAILAHHYQTDAVIRHADLRGDSLELSRRVPELSARHIVFCGVFFMAESAALLASGGQESHIPDPAAGCVMSQMAPHRLLEAVYARVTASGRRVVPLAYVNTSAAVKAVVGRHGGAVCTSANAATMLRWALERGDAVLFLPDRNLAANTADAIGLDPAERHVLDVRGGGTRVDTAAAEGARLLAYPGCCAVHARFNAAQVAAARKAHPGCSIIVHPECAPEVVRAVDASGSTSAIIRHVAQAPDGATVIVGTEINLVRRLAAEQAGRVTVLPLAESGCSNMARITETNLLALLEALRGGRAEPVRVAPDTVRHARAALERMLEACS
jgi:quinolinate synthase